MAVTPSAQYSVTIRVEMDSTPTLLGQLTTAIGAVGGDIGAIDLVGTGSNTLIRELVVNQSLSSLHTLTSSLQPSRSASVVSIVLPAVEKL